MESVRENNCQNVFASFTPTRKVTFKRGVEPLGIGIRFIALIFEELGSHSEDTKIPRITGILNSSSNSFTQVVVRRFADVFGEF